MFAVKKLMYKTICGCVQCVPYLFSGIIKWKNYQNEKVFFFVLALATLIHVEYKTGCVIRILSDKSSNYLFRNY